MEMYYVPGTLRGCSLFDMCYTSHVIKVSSINDETQVCEELKSDKFYTKVYYNKYIGLQGARQIAITKLPLICFLITG